MKLGIGVETRGGDLRRDQNFGKLKDLRTFVNCITRRSQHAEDLMASTFSRLGVTVRCCNFRIPPRSTSRIPHPPYRQFSSSYQRRRDGSSSQPPPSFVSTLDPEDRADYEALSPEERKEVEAAAKDLETYMTSREVESGINSEVASAAHELAIETGFLKSEHEVVRPKRGAFMPMGELDEYGTGDDDDFAEDDISSTAHGELEQHREIREFARLAAWEMPMLSSAFLYNLC